MNHSFQPVTVTTHTGSVYEPMAVSIVDGALIVSDRDGTLIATATTVDGAVRGGRRRRTVETTEGRWLVEDICGCGSQKRALLRYWRHKD